MSPEELEQVTTQVTSSKAFIDAMVAANKKGVNLVPAFRCGHSGMYYPSDYLEEWGIGYGVGLGPTVVSECLDSIYTTEPAELKYCRSIDDIQHPVQVCHAQLDFVMVPKSEYDANLLIAHQDDLEMQLRRPIIIANQLDNPMSKIGMYRTEFKQGARK